MLQLVKESTLKGLYNKIDELERQLQGANAHSKTLEEDYLKKLREKNDEITACNKKINDRYNEIKDLGNKLGTEQADNKSLRESLESSKKRYDEASKQLDRQKRYQKEFSTQKTKEVSELKEQLENANKRIEEDDKDLKELRAKVSMMSILHKAGVEELTKFMRSTPAYKKLKKDVVRETADTWICEHAKKEIENLPQAPKPEETKEEVKKETENKEESKDKE